ncbi:unnamed protein product [Ambrosiozyma monospora]|uniref:Unnamed protein product n=1 Tax=Ambrosiozyma monospora TaxID=43982 RepID=A0ACB5T2R7_AMBMO|nr:unnamed protein product [Ambrosiozyma monospora]
MSALKNDTGILSNSYIPPIRKTVLSKELQKLSAESLFDVVQLWLSLDVTQPRVSEYYRKKGLSRRQVIKKLKDFMEKTKNIKQAFQRKKKLIDRILVYFYPKGLNSLQLAQLDIQCMVEKPNSYSWISSSAKIVTDVLSGRVAEDDGSNLADFVFSLDAQNFLDNLIKNLSNLYLTHIYISRHPTMPLIIIRIQMYELSHLRRKQLQKDEPNLISRRPFYLIIPTSSTNLIHSVLDPSDTASKLIMQSVEMTLSSSLHRVKLIQNEEFPIKSLDAMHILKGVSKFAESLGSWAPYADGTVDMNPLDDPTNHMIMKLGMKDDDDLNSEETEEERKIKRRKLVANLRFKGTLKNELKSDLLYETNKLNKKGKEKEIENEYQSIVPVQHFEYVMNNPFSATNQRTKPQSESASNPEDAAALDAPSIRFRFFGNDVFAGLHEEAVKGNIDPETMPDWLTSLPSNPS